MEDRENEKWGVEVNSLQYYTGNWRESYTNLHALRWVRNGKQGIFTDVCIYASIP